MNPSLLIYVLRRLLWTLPTLLLVGLLVFMLMRLVPGDPALLILGDSATPEQLASLRAAWGLDKPIGLQFFYWLGQVLQGDLGQSITSSEPVMPLLLQRFQVSASIVLVAVALAVLLAVPAGLYAAWKQNSIVDTVVVATATFFLSIPSFWLGLLLLLFVGLKLGLVPVVGYVPFAEDWRASITFLILPVVTLTLIELGVLTRMSRASAVETLRLEYVTHARAKGLSERRVLLRHVLPNAFAPTWTLVGLVLGNLLGGIAVLETVFTLPGLGRLLVDAIFARDYPVVQGCMLFTAAIYVLVNLVVDLCYPLFDPRVSAT
ncbi:ABC transporter permease [Ramlibacter sp. WS9]|uniref:ABC transporter permease n=1 Tax=Ramlibacter sp. WS9 TaxID=1882741 RepID=UPI001141D5BA|nr:ABC transporter permease [Ramlibacter sp. WS9]ROZ64186.1 ABC transporter permease [Ramlibacter sp. WS9]